MGATGPVGPAGPTPTSDTYSDYLFWNTNGATWNVGSAQIHVGANAGLSNQGSLAVAVGSDAGRISQGDLTVAVGGRAGKVDQHALSVAVGADAGNANQGTSSVAVGAQSGYVNQGEYAVALGFKAGYQNQQPNSIVINAWNTALNGSNAGSFYVRPIRDATGSAPANMLYYDTGASEVVSVAASSASNTVSSITKSALISYTDGGASDSPRFVTNGVGTSVVLTANQRVQLQVTVQCVISASSTAVLAATLGRGTVASPSDSYINLANSTAFSSTPLQAATSAATVGHLLTSCAQTSVDAGTKPYSLTFTVVDAPGAATWFYALQMTTSTPATLYVRNTYITATVLNL